MQEYRLRFLLKPDAPRVAIVKQANNCVNTFRKGKRRKKPHFMTNMSWVITDEGMLITLCYKVGMSKHVKFTQSVIDQVMRKLKFRSHRIANHSKLLKLLHKHGKKI